MDRNQMEINICHLYPDVLNLYGDTGNILCLVNRLKWRGIGCKVTELPVGEPLRASDHDIFFMGGGQDFEQSVLLEDANRYKKREIESAIDEEKVFLAICGGYQILGNYYQTHDGKQYDFMGCLDIHTIGHKDRMIGNFMFACDDLHGETVVGFENHSGKTYLGDRVKPLGRVIRGRGNNGEDGTEGARYKNVFASYSHGPLLPKNPKLCDLLLEKALVRKYGEVNLSALDDELENKAHDYMEKRLSVQG
ncbi:MAG: type 1 glutamine amidotransferase [Anaerovoracaceae bacterium]